MIRTLYCWVLSKEVSSTIFKVFGMIRPRIEPRFSGPLANTLFSWFSVDGPPGWQKYYYFILLGVFSNQRQLIVSHRSKFPQVSSSLLSILADLNNTIVWMISTCPLISISSSPFTNLWLLYQAHQLQLVSPSLLWWINFSFFWLGRGTYLAFRFLLVLPSGQLERQGPLFGSFSCFCWLPQGLVVWLSMVIHF